MALFPKVEFDILVDGGAIVPGRRTNAILVVTTAREIPRVEHIVVTFRSTLFLTPNELRRQIFAQEIRIDAPKTLDAGTHRLPLVLEAPPWLPPGFRTEAVSLTHDVHAVLAVTGAVFDPHAEKRAVVEPAPIEARRMPVVTRSPRDFHPSIALEITLDSSVIVHGAPLHGTVRIVAGGEREIDGVELSITSTITPPGSQTVLDTRAFIDGRALFDGRAASFEVPLALATPPSFASPALRHDLAVVAHLIRRRVPPRSFGVPIRVLPKGSSVISDTPLPLDHLRRWGIAISNATDLLPGIGDVIAHGAVGPIRLSLREARHRVRISFEVPGGPAGTPEDIELLDNDDDAIVDAARRAVDRAKKLAKSIAAQPWSPDAPAEAEAHWRAAGGFLVPSAPSIHDLVFPLRLLGNEERLISVQLRTIRPNLQITVDLRNMPLPENAIGPIQNGRLPGTNVSMNGDTLTLTVPWTNDPRSLYPAIETLLDWALDARDERRATAAYR